MSKVYKISHFYTGVYTLMTRDQLNNQSIGWDRVTINTPSRDVKFYGPKGDKIEYIPSIFTTTFKNKDEMLRYLDKCDASDDFDCKVEDLLNES